MESLSFITTALTTAGYLIGFAAALYFIASSVLLSIRSERTVRRLAAEVGRSDIAPADIKFVLVLPMLREETIVARTMGQFLEAIEEGVPIDVVVATTSREMRERDRAIELIVESLRARQGVAGVEPLLVRTVLDEEKAAAFSSLLATPSCDPVAAEEFLRANLRAATGDVVRALLPELNRAAGREAFFHMEAPPEAKGKVGQMNAAVDYWRARAGGGTMGNVYVGVYDADSKPDQRVFDAIRHILGERERSGLAGPGIFQQVSCYCQNLHELKGTLGAVSLADALAQTRWALGFEYPLYETYAQAVHAGETRRLIYCVGHGCFVSLAVLDEIGGFPTCSPTDDLALGYLASVAGIEARPVPVLDYCDVAPNPFASIRQSRFWYLGSARFHRDIAFFEERFGFDMGRWQRFWLWFDGRARCFFWAWRSMLWVGSMLFAVAVRSWPLAVLLLAAHLLYVQVGFLHTLRLLRRLPRAGSLLRIDRLSAGRVLLATLLSSVTFLVRGLGPMSASLGFKPPSPGGVAWKIER